MKKLFILILITILLICNGFVKSESSDASKHDSSASKYDSSASHIADSSKYDSSASKSADSASKHDSSASDTADSGSKHDSSASKSDSGSKADSSSSSSSGSSSSSFEPSEIVTLIVNSNNNNVYPTNGFCGNSSLTCNNLVDAINYFNTIAVVQQPLPGVYGSLFQQLNLLLADGLYNVNSNSVNLYQYNLTITPLTPNSDQVIFDGTTTTNTGDALFTVFAPITSNDTESQTTRLEFIGVNFNNFSQPILNVSTIGSFTNVQFEICSISNYNSKVYPMIDINSGVAESSSFANGVLVFNQTTLSNLVSDVPIIETSNCYGRLYDTIVQDSTFTNFYNMTYGTSMRISNSSFIKLTTQTGIFATYNSFIIFDDCTFTNNLGNVGPSVLTLSTDLTGNFFRFSNSIFTDNTGVDGGVISGLSTYVNNTIGCTINSSQFYGSSAINGGVIYLNNLPLNINNTIFGNNIASSAGGSIYLLSTGKSKLIQLSNVTFAQSGESNEEFDSALTLSSANGNVLYLSGATLNIVDSSFDPKYTETIYCVSSVIQIDSESEFDSASISCGSLCVADIVDNSICGDSTTSGTSSTTSTTGTTTGTDSGSESTTTTTGTGTGSITGKTSGSSLTVTSTTSTTSPTTGDSTKSRNPSFMLIGLICLAALYI